MTWDAYHRRGAALRTVVEAANQRRDGHLPLELPGVAETFAGETELVTALQLRWHTRLAGQIERALSEEPFDLETAVLTAWRRTASELAGVRAILDARNEQARDPQLARALRRANRKDWDLMAAMAGQAAAGDPAAARIGQRLEEKARAAYDPAAPRPTAAGAAPGHSTLLDRLLAHLAA